MKEGIYYSPKLNRMLLIWVSSYGIWKYQDIDRSGNLNLNFQCYSWEWAYIGEL